MLGVPPNNDSQGDATSMTITLRDVDPQTVDLDALSRGIAQVAVHVPDMNRVDVVVTGDFEGYVRASDPSGDASYRQQRLLGGAQAMVLSGDRGRSELVVDIDVVGIDRDADANPVGVFVHEALHIAVAQRDESLYGRRARLGIALGSAVGYVEGLAGLLGEEFRVQRALADLGHPLEASYRAELAALVHAFRESLQAPFVSWDETGDITDLGEAFAPGFRDLATVVGYVIGDDVASGGARAPDLAALGAARWVRAGYPALRAALAALPPATEPMPLACLDELCDSVANAVEDWMADVGFALRDIPGGIFIELLDPDELAADLIAVR